MIEKINLAEKLDGFSDHWAPRIVARYNDHEVRLVKVEGEFIWHKHDDSDELFLILEGELDVEFRDRTVTLRPGELIVVPRGTEHRPVSRHGETKCCSSIHATCRTRAMRRPRRSLSKFKKEKQECSAM